AKKRCNSALYTNHTRPRKTEITLKREEVCARVHNRQNVAFPDWRQTRIPQYVIRRMTAWPNDVDCRRGVSKRLPAAQKSVVFVKRRKVDWHLASVRQNVVAMIGFALHFQHPQ